MSDHYTVWDELHELLVRFEAEKAVKILKKEADNIYKDVIEKLTEDKGII